MIKKLIEEVPRRKILLGLASALGLVLPGEAQDTAGTNAPTVLKPSVVTGSYIPTAETVGPAPVAVVSSAQISASGSQDVLAALVKLDPAFSGSGNLGQVANNFSINGAVPSGEANVAIRNLPTLVMLNGLRLPNSALSGGQAVDLNTIPISVIDHVEILKDGASALYGSDAVGGVVNVITKKNWNGTEIAGRVGFPTRPDSNDILERRASVIAGATADNYSFFAGAQYYAMDPLLAKDRPIASMGVADLIKNGINPAVAYMSPSFPGRVQDNTGAYILAGSPFAAGAAGYNPSLVTPPVFPGQQFYGPNAIQHYNTYAIGHGYVDPTGHGLGPYLPLANTPQGAAIDALDPSGALGIAGFYPLLNTTEFGVHSIQSQDRRNFFADVEHDLFDKNLVFFGQFLYANNLSRGELAPSPVPSLNGSGITVPASDPYNPFGVTLGVGQGTGTNAPPRVRSRFEESGNRLFDAQSDTYHIVGGLKGEVIPGKLDWIASYNYNRADQTYFTRNAINGAALNDSLAGTLTDASGNPLPVYNIFSAVPGQNGPDVINGVRTTLFNSGVSQLWGVDAHVHATPFDLPAGPLDAVAGIQYTYESLNLAVDGLTQLGLVPGLNQAFPFPGGTRDREAVFAEVRIPIFSEKWNVPGFYDLSLDVQGRYERIFPGGDDGVPKIQARWQPIDKQLTLRGGYGQSFLAPSIYSLFGPDFFSNPFITIPNGGGSGQVQTQNKSNPNLPPSNAQNWNAGIVYSPKFVKGLTVSVDYYNISQDNVVVSDPFSAAADLAARGSASPFAGGFTFADGSRLSSPTPGQVTVNNWGNLILTNTAAASLRTDGLDISAAYELPTDQVGKFTLLGNANWIHDYEIRSGPTKGYYRYEGQWTANFGTAQGLIPDYRLNVGLTWEFSDFTYNVMAHYIPAVTDLGFLHPETAQPIHGETLNGLAWHVPDYYTIDMQLAYRFGPKWGRYANGLTLAVGCNNITDTDPPLIASAIEDNTDKGTYDILGRFVYFEISKSF